MDDTPPPQDGALRLLKWLVIALTATMLVGIVVITVLLVARLRGAPLALPDEIVLPDGTQPLAFTRGQDWLAVATRNEILIFDATGQSLRQRIEIARD